MTATDAGEIGRRGWRQGSVVRDDLAAKLRAESLLPPDIPEGAVFVVVSHDCDLTNDSFEKEPQIELLVVRPATKQALRLQGRDPRCLQIPIEGAPDGSLLEARAHGRFFLDRQVLLGHSPHAEMRLGDQSRRRLADWLAKRYSRAAFPDEFNRRLQPAQEEIKKLFRQQGRLGLVEPGGRRIATRFAAYRTGQHPAARGGERTSGHPTQHGHAPRRPKAGSVRRRPA